jgi:hypothetical protein
MNEYFRKANPSILLSEDSILSNIWAPRTVDTAEYSKGVVVLQCLSFFLVYFVHNVHKIIWSVFWNKMRKIVTFIAFFGCWIFLVIFAFCAAAYVSAIWRIYSSKELQRSIWKFWFRGSANNNWIDHFPGMLRIIFCTPSKS